MKKSPNNASSRLLRGLLASGLACLGVTPSLAEPDYHVTLLPSFVPGQVGFSYASSSFKAPWEAGLPEGSYTAVYGINDSGSLAVTTGALSYGPLRGFITEGLNPSGSLSPTSSSWSFSAWAINESGHGAGDATVSSGYRNAIYFDGVQAVSLGTLGGHGSRAFALDDAGNVVGWAQDENGAMHAFLYNTQAETPVMVDLHVNELATAFDSSAAFAINNHGIVVGYAENGTGALSAFVMDTATLQVNSLNFQSGGTQLATVATGINDPGDAVGWYLRSDGTRGAVLWRGANTQDVEAVDLHGALAGHQVLGALAQSSAAAINTAGWVVGDAWDQADADTTFGLDKRTASAFLYDGEQSYLLKDLVRSDRSWVIRSAQSINDHGQIGATAYSSTTGYSGVVLSQIRAWATTEGGDWDTAANWADELPPDAHTAAFIELGDGQTVTGPAADATIYALTLKAETLGDSATLALAENSTLSVIGDTRLLGGTLDASAEGSALNTGVLWGYGTVEGTVNAGAVWIDRYATLTMRGEVTAAQGLLIDIGSTLNAEGSVTGRVSSAAGGVVNATGDLVLGDAASQAGVSLYRLNAADHTVTLHDADQAEVAILTMAGAEVSAANGLRVAKLSGHGSVAGEMAIAGLLQVDEGKTLAIDGDISGAGLLIGDVAFSEGHGYSASGTASLTEALTYSDGAAALLGSVIARASLSLDNVQLQSVGGETELYVQAGLLSGSGDWAIDTIQINGGGLVATGDLALGVSETGSFRSTRLVDLREHDLLIRGVAAVISDLAMDGGELTFAGATGEINRLTGHGTIDGSVYFETGGSFNRIASVNLTGDLTAGDAASENGFASDGLFGIGEHTLTILDSDEAIFSAYSQTDLAGGKIVAANGLRFEGAFSDQPLGNPLLRAGGEAATSTIEGDVAFSNAVIEATAGNTLNIEGNLTGYGIVIGDVNYDALQADAIHSVKLLGDLDIGDRTAAFVSAGESVLNGVVVALAGGLVEAENGILAQERTVISGYGAIALGEEAELAMDNGILAADEGETLMIGGNVVGRGLVIGDVQVAEGYSLFASPTDHAALTRSADIGTRTATFHGGVSSGGLGATVYGTHRSTIDSFGRLLAHDTQGELAIGGGTIVAGNGLELNNTCLSGHGTVQGDLLVTNSVLDITEGETLTVEGGISGYGVVMGTVAATTSSLASPTSQVDFQSTGQLLEIGGKTAVIRSLGEAAFGNVTSQGGTLEASSGMTLSTYEGYGAIDGDLRLANSIVFVDAGKELTVSGAFTGYGIVVGAVDKSIADPTGVVTYNTGYSDFGEGRPVTVYSAAPAYFSDASFSAGSHVSIARGAVFGSLRGSATLEVASGNKIVINGLLSPGFSPGTLEVIGGSLELGLAALTEIEYFGIGAGEYDFLEIGETFTLGGTLKIVFADGYDPGLGTILPGFFSANAVEGAFDHVIWSGLANGMGVQFDSLTHQLSVIEVAAVPEPGAWVLLVAGLGSTWLMRRRRAAA